MKSITTNTPYYNPTIPKICVIGRPNVGKSTLFNRLLGKRKSITDPTAGVTRDPVRSLWQCNGHDLVLVDTGGLTESRNYLDQLITSRSFSAAQDADVLILVLDVVEGITSDDEMFIKRLRGFSERLIVAVNKVDNEKRDQEVWNFHKLGFSRVLGVSATHGYGFEELREEILTVLAIVRDDSVYLTELYPDEPNDPQEQSDDQSSGPVAQDDADDLVDDGSQQEADENGQVPHDNELKASRPALLRGRERASSWDLSIAILGQPNTGKSTLVNLLTNSDMSIVSPVAGTTRDVIEGSFSYKDKVFRILDTAGIRRKARVHEDLEYYSVNRAIASIEEADVVFLMMDAEKGLVDQDKKIAQQIINHGRACILVLNKWDLLPNLPNQFAAVTDRVRYLFPVLSFAPVMAISALNAQGINELLAKAVSLHQQLLTRMDTGQLNSRLTHWLETTPPPTSKGALRWKMRYITQTSVHPLEFVIFVNRVDGFPESYLGFITNRLRTECGLSEVPFRVHLRAR